MCSPLPWGCLACTPARRLQIPDSAAPFPQRIRKASLRPRGSGKNCRILPKTLQTATELYPSFSPSCKCNRILSSISEKHPEQPDHCSPVADQARSWVSAAPGSGTAVGREGLCQGIQGRSSHVLSLWVCVLSWFSKCGAERLCFGSAQSRGCFYFPLAVQRPENQQLFALCCQWNCICDKPTSIFLIVWLVG